MATSPATILIVGTLDTKLDELLYLRSQIIALSNKACKVQVLDVSRQAKAASSYPSIPESELITPLVDSTESLQDLTRGKYVDQAIQAGTPVVKELVKDGKVQGVVAIGGSTGTSLASAIMRGACPIGLPKLIVSTMASGNVQPYVDTSDITIMYSVVDIAGLNSMLKKILSNAAGAISGMAMTYASLNQRMDDLAVAGGKRIGVTMFGVTTQCVDNIRKILTSTPHDVSDYEIYVFHATGSGGRALERLIDEGQIDAVVDLTTTEVADELVGGILSAGPDRLEVAARKGIPMILSVGACDMVNFGPPDTVPKTFKDRDLYEHNPSVTLMRTNKEENIEIAKFITSKLKKNSKNTKTIRVLLPKGGVSALDRANVEKPTTSSASATAQTQPPSDPIKATNGNPWHDAVADTALFETVMQELDGSGIEVFEYPDNINDDPFAISICEHLLEVMGIDPRQYRLANARRRQWSFNHGSSISKITRRNSVEIPDVA